MPIFCKQCEEEIVNGEKCICISEGAMHGTEFEPDSGDEEDWIYLHSRCVERILAEISHRAYKKTRKSKLLPL